MAIDLVAAREAFASSTDLTVGLEEEFATCDPETLQLAPRFEELRDAGQGDPVLAESIAGELISSEIEIRSGKGETFQAALNAQRDRRRRLFALADAHGVALGSTGTHALADYREQQIIDTEHYRILDRDLRWVAWRNNTWSVHAHVGVHDADRAVAACDRLRGHLPTLLALSANSPYIDCIDSGLHSGRTEIFTRTFPRCGVPEPYGDWDAFAAYVRFLEQTNSIDRYTQVWWSIRPHVAFGTVEVRICDSQSTAAEAESLEALMVACIGQALRDHDEGRPAPALAGRLIEENVWRATRYGLDGKLIDLPHPVERPARAAVEGLLEWTAPVRSELGLDIVLPERNGAQRQRAMIEEGATPHDVLAAAVRETRDSYPRQEVVA
jgi:glutamate---cysteine ligase / carboxylate-amine ligase